MLGGLFIMRAIRNDAAQFVLTPAQQNLLTKGVLDDSIVKFLKSTLMPNKLPGVVDISVGSSSVQAREAVNRIEVEVPFSFEYELRGREWGMADGVVVDLPGTVRMSVDETGRVQGYICECPDDNDVAAALASVRGRLARGEIAPRPPDPEDLRALMRRGQPYYVTVDSSGRKRLERAFFSTSSPRLRPSG